MTKWSVSSSRREVVHGVDGNHEVIGGDANEARAKLSGALVSLGEYALLRWTGCSTTLLDAIPGFVWGV